VFKRLLWLVTGAGFGFGLSFWITRALRRAIGRWAPASVAARIQAGARSVVADAQGAWSDGRAAMEERQRVLREGLGDGRPGLGPGPGEGYPPSRSWPSDRSRAGRPALRTGT
jgi:hypothetical protein